MAKQVTKTATPRLRFPEFRATPEWRVKRMDRLYAFMRNNLLSRDKLNYEAGPAKNIHYGDIHTKFPVLFDITKERVPFVSDAEDVAAEGSEDYCIEGDVIFADASEDMNDVGKAMEVIFLNGERLLSGQHTILARRKDESLIIGFGGYLFRSGLIRSRIQKEAQGTKVYQISSSRLGGIDITYPADTDEQKKIADCLTSLDDVIAAQGRKVETLKAHKRGLMQQLFPREGETRPRLRFPEFRDGPDWHEQPLGELVDLLSGYPFDGKDIVEDRSGERLMRGINITEGVVRHNPEIDRYYLGSMDGLEKYRLEEYDLVIGMDGSKVGKNSSLILGDDVGALLIQRVARLRAGSAPLINFIFHQIHSPKFHAYVDRINTSSGIPHISAKQIRDYRIHSTSDAEQQRIADCLSSLDAQITAESNQHATLKTHKRGLMQQLFPAPDAATA
jgi:type I restriction enzyme S subunit